MMMISAAGTPVTSTYDIIIVGGGMTGAALGLALSQQTSLSIAILESEANPPMWVKSQYHHRVSAITLASQRILQSLDVWRSIQAKRISPFTKIIVWDAETNNDIAFDSCDIAESHLGHIIENSVIQSSLHEKLMQEERIHWVAPVKLVSFCEKEKSVELIAADGHIFTAPLVIAADGARSWLRKSVGIAVDKQDYEQKAIVTTVQTALPHEQTARQVFLAEGPLAFLPLADRHTCSIVWSLPTAEADRLMNVDDNIFKTKLGHAFSHRLGDIMKIEKCFAFPLYKQQAKQYVQSRVALVGDAAHIIHPLAGQGINMGLLDAMSLVEVITDALKAQQAFATPFVLRRYERWRRADNMGMLAGVDLIKMCFASSKAPIRTLRNIGLNFINRLPWIKSKLTRHAVGNRSCLPAGAKI